MRIDRKIDPYKKRRKTRVTFELTTDYYNFITRPFNKPTRIIIHPRYRRARYRDKATSIRKISKGRDRRKEQEAASQNDDLHIE